MATPRSVECSVERSWDKSHRRDRSAHARVTSSFPTTILLLREVYTLLRRYCTRAGLSYNLSTLVECAAFGRDGRTRDASRTHISGMHRERPNAGVRKSRDLPASLVHPLSNWVGIHKLIRSNGHTH
ncbi:hypothetical protein ACFW04_008682 [Cataglyphis niger]